MTYRGNEFFGVVLSEPEAVKKLELFLQQREESLKTALVQFSLKEEGEAAGLPRREAYRYLWEHVELLEGCIQELFVQIASVSIDRWDAVLAATVSGFKELLARNLKNSEELLEEIEGGKASSLLARLKSWLAWRLPVDKGLRRTLQRTKRLLDKLYGQFAERYAAYEKRSKAVAAQAEKLKEYEVLLSLGGGLTDEFKRLYRLLKLWDNGEKYREDFPKEMLVALKQFPREKTMQLFLRYFHALEDALYDKSRALKSAPRQLFSEVQGRAFFLETLKSQRREVHTLGATINKYKELSLRSDPNPYVRSRWGFVETPVGPEPKYATKLADLGYAVEELDLSYVRLIAALERGPNDSDQGLLAEADASIQEYLHTMSQPLIPAHLERYCSDKVLHILERLDELGSYGRAVVDYSRYVLARLLKADWRGYILQEMPLFQQLYILHQNTSEIAGDVNHRRRLEKLDILLKQVRYKMRAEGSVAMNDIEYDVNDIKGYLQDFLATLQRTSKVENLSAVRARCYIEDASQCLLEYRYLFSAFFSSLQHEAEGIYLRCQFSFVDHYFDSFEETIQAFRDQYGIDHTKNTQSSEVRKE